MEEFANVGGNVAAARKSDFRPRLSPMQPGAVPLGEGRACHEQHGHRVAGVAGSGFDLECWNCREITACIDGARLHMRGLDIYPTSQRPGAKPAFLVRNPGPTDDDMIRRLEE